MSSSGATRQSEPHTPRVGAWGGPCTAVHPARSLGLASSSGGAPRGAVLTSPLLWVVSGADLWVRRAVPAAAGAAHGGAASPARPAPRECGRLSGPPVSPAPQWRGCRSLGRHERGIRCPHARTLERAAGGTHGAGVLSCSWRTCQPAELWQSARLSPRFRCQNSGPLGPLHRGSAPSVALQVRLVAWAAATAHEAVGQSDGSARTLDPCPVPQLRTGLFPTLPFPECLRNDSTACHLESSSSATHLGSSCPCVCPSVCRVLL